MQLEPQNQSCDINNFWIIWLHPEIKKTYSLLYKDKQNLIISNYYNIKQWKMLKLSG